MKICIAFGAMLLAVWLAPLLSQRSDEEKPVSDTLSAKRFELLDDEGRVRIEMRIEDGQPVIALKDKLGRDRVTVFHQADATGVYVKDGGGDTRVGLAQFPHGGGLAMHGEHGVGSAVYVLMNNRARLDIYNAEGKLTNRWPEPRK